MNTLRPCPLCGNEPLFYNSPSQRDGSDSWYIHCRKEDEHTDDMLDMGILCENSERDYEFTKCPEANHLEWGAYGHKNSTEAELIWNNFVDNFPKKALICYQSNCHHGTQIYDWAGASANHIEAGIHPCFSCNTEEWDKVPRKP